MENSSSSEGRDPSAFLGEIIGAPVTVKLNSGVVYKGFYIISILCISIFVLIISTGELQSVDGYMNIALERSEEFVDGKLKRSYGDAFIRGNNGLSCIQSFLDPPSILMNLVLYISAQWSIFPWSFIVLAYSPYLVSMDAPSALTEPSSLQS